MEGQTKNTVELMEFDAPPSAENDENNAVNVHSDLAQEAALLAQSLNEKLQSLSAEDAELFMSNFEKNVFLLPKNTKTAVSNCSNKLPKHDINISGHDFVGLDPINTSAAKNEISNGISLFGTSKPPQIFTSKYFSPPKPYAFLKENKTDNNKYIEESKSNNIYQRQRLESRNKQTNEENLTKRNLLAAQNQLVENSKNEKQSTSFTADAKIGYGSPVKETKTTVRDDMKSNKPECTTKVTAAIKEKSNKENEEKLIQELEKLANKMNQQNGLNNLPPKSTISNMPQHISCPLSLNAVQTQVANVTEQNNDWLQQQKLNQMQTHGNRKSINILVLGQTGVGKSTWINAFANYLSYSTLEQAIAAEAPVCVIPTKFSLFDDNYQRHEVLLGNHNNEIFSDKGQSATQNAKTYLFEKNDHDIYIIDTPGMDDTRGPKQDDENIQKILRAVAPFKELHAICFLFKANESRLTQSFKYCISKLLGNLSKSALSNACFVFTNARGTFYKPGDTMGPLKAYFKELQVKENLSVAINDSNTFCLDNEAFRFICAYFSRIKFGDHELKTYADSWKHSSNEIIRLLNHAARLRPHATSETLSINETRTWILQLVKPIIDVSSVIQDNLLQLDEQIKELETTNNNIVDLQKRANIPLVSLEIIPLKAPQTVCASEKCIRHEEISGKLQPIYKTVCHENCNVDAGDPSEIPDPALESCMLFFTGTKNICRKCQCSVKDHRRIFYKQKIVTKELEAQAIQNALASEVDASKLKRKLIRRCQCMVDGYKKELDYVLFAMANFSTFLAQNAVSQKADIFEKHLENLIKTEEKMLRSVKDYDSKKPNQSVNLLLSYQDIRHKLINTKPSTSISLTEIQDIRQRLFAMPLTGSKIAEIFDIHVTVETKEHADNVTRCDTKSMIWQYFANKVTSFFGRK